MGRPEDRTHVSNYVLTLAVAVLAFAGLSMTRLDSCPLFHTLAEFFRITVACLVFAVFWSAGKFLDNAC